MGTVAESNPAASPFADSVAKVNLLPPVMQGCPADSDAAALYSSASEFESPNGDTPGAPPGEVSVLPPSENEWIGSPSTFRPILAKISISAEPSRERAPGG